MASEEALLSPLGKNVLYPKQYDPTLLYPIARATNRKHLNLTAPNLPFYGVDIWDAFELFYLNAKGKPVVALGQFIIPCESENIVEAKSLKLYLNSYVNMRFDSEDALRARITQDLSVACKRDVEVMIEPLATMALTETVLLQPQDYHCIDHLDVAINTDVVTPSLLKTIGSESNSEKLCSHLFKAHCPVTGQPDWASIFIDYTGAAIDHAGLLRYIVSYRDHTEFHEHCMERMFTDIMHTCQLEKLFIYAEFTRRGGICTTPMRSNYQTTFAHKRGLRQ